MGQYIGAKARRQDSMVFIVRNRRMPGIIYWVRPEVYVARSPLPTGELAPISRSKPRVHVLYRVRCVKQSSAEPESQVDT